MLEALDSVTTPDPYTVVVRFREPFAPFINYAASERLPIVPHEIYDLDGHFKDRIAGTGAFQLDAAASQKGTRWVFRKNPNYWEPGRPYLDEVRWVVIRDTAAGFVAFQTRQVDEAGYRYGITANDAALIEKNNPQAVKYGYR